MTRWPDLAALELLVAVAEEHSLGAAARRLGLAQPNASRTVRALEAELKVTLLVRHPRGSKPTPQGEAVVEWARSLLAEAATFRSLTATLSGKAAELVVAASMTVAEHLMPGWLARLRAVNPSAHVRLQVENSEDVSQLVKSGAVAVGFVEGAHTLAGVTEKVVATDRLVLVVAPQHPWARGGPVPPDALAATRLVTREEGSGTREVLERALAAWGVPGTEVARPAVVLNSNAAVLASVCAGVAPAVISQLAVSDQIAAGRLVEVPLGGLSLTRPLRAVWRAGRVPRGGAADLVRIAST